MLQPIAAEKLKACNLFMNESKTDHTYLAENRKQTRDADCTVATKSRGQAQP